MIIMYTRMSIGAVEVMAWQASSAAQAQARAWAKPSLGCTVFSVQYRFTYGYFQNLRIYDYMYVCIHVCIHNIQVQII